MDAASTKRLHSGHRLVVDGFALMSSRSKAAARDEATDA